MNNTHIILIVDKSVLHFPTRVRQHEIIQLPLGLLPSPISVRQRPRHHALQRPQLQTHRLAVTNRSGTRWKILLLPEDVSKRLAFQSDEAMAVHSVFEARVRRDEGGAGTGGKGEDVAGEAVVGVVGEVDEGGEIGDFVGFGGGFGE